MRQKADGWEGSAQMEKEKRLREVYKKKKMGQEGFFFFLFFGAREFGGNREAAGRGSGEL